MMGHINSALVRNAPRSPEDLLSLLFEGLDWPKPSVLDIDEIPLMDWSPEELHLDPESIAKLTRIRQLPKLTDSQPFGVFILSFEGGRLPIGAIRRVVSRLVRKQRATATRTGSLWDLHDLIFFCQSHGGTSSLHIVAFKDTAKVPVMKVISWSTDATDNRIELVTTENLVDLVWPTGPSANDDAWRERWNSAFTASYREGIRSADALATRMANVAKTVRDEALALYDVESDDGPLRELFREIKANLKSDLNPLEFADLYAQTMVYGLLTARIMHPEDFHADAINSVLKFENPFLDALYSSFRDKSDQAFDVDEFGLHELAELFARTDVDQILADFGVDERKEDPVVFFYEKFLEIYDPDERRELGTYYTPIPIVRFMVRAIDHLIKERFGLSGGIADASDWVEYSRRSGQRIPEGLDDHDPVISMIDPATGTGTFLLEWYREAMDDLGSEGTNDQKIAVLGRMDALEINASSYTIAHLKTGLELPPDIRASHRINIRLADTLSRRSADERLAIFADDPIAEEGLAAEEVKFQHHHSIVIGNPPYLRSDRRNAGGWIVHPTEGGRSLFEDILEPARSNTVFSHLRSLSNLYVYFWRWAIWKAFEQSVSGPGIVGFITASSWLSGPGFMGLRQLARQMADEIFVIDLGGDNLGARPEENVFDIQIPVAIVLLIRSGYSERAEPAIARYRRITGTRADKLSALQQMNIADQDWATAPSGWLDPFVPTAGGRDWESYPALSDLLPWQQPGCIHARTWPVSPSQSTLKKRWSMLVSAGDPQLRAEWFSTAKTGRSIKTKVRNLPRIADLTARSKPEQIVRYGYRSFDRQFTFDDPRLAKTESPSLWASASPSQIFMVTSMTFRLGMGPAATLSTAIPDYHYYNGRGGKDVIPLYRDADGSENIDPRLLEELTAIYREAAPAISDVTAQNVFSYVYGILAGADYSERFREELETPGPRIPFTRDPSLFNQVVKHGEFLIWLHTYGERSLDEKSKSLQVPSEIWWRQDPKRVPVDTSDYAYSATNEQLVVGDGILCGVPAEAWEFAVSGMPIIKKWLGYRTLRGSGRAASTGNPLDQIRPKDWEAEWSVELKQLVFVLAESVKMREAGRELLDSILAGSLISANEIPAPTQEMRAPPPVRSSSGREML